MTKFGESPLWGLFLDPKTQQIICNYCLTTDLVNDFVLNWLDFHVCVEEDIQGVEFFASCIKAKQTTM